MKNVIKLIGFIAFTAIIAFTMTAAGCDNGSTGGGGNHTPTLTIEDTVGKLTVNGLGSFNGKNVIGESESGTNKLWACVDPEVENGNQIIVYDGKISSGEVTLKVWKSVEHQGLRNYNTTETVAMKITI